MNVIEGNASMLRDALNDEEFQAHARAIEERAAALSSLSDQAGTVRSLFDDGSPTETGCDVTQLLTEVVDEVSDTYPDATLTTGESDSVHAQADSRLKIALTELLENAITHNDQPTPEATVTTRQSTGDRTGEWIEIKIADNGPGIPDHDSLLHECEISSDISQATH